MLSALLLVHVFYCEKPRVGEYNKAGVHGGATGAMNHEISFCFVRLLLMKIFDVALGQRWCGLCLQSHAQDAKGHVAPNKKPVHV